MKTLTRDEEKQIETNFAFNQANPALPDTWVCWAGSYAVLIREEDKQDLAQWPVASNVGVIYRVMAYCVKNGLRCSKIVNGVIHL